MAQESNLSTAQHPNMQNGDVIWTLDNFVIDNLPSQVPNAGIPKYELCNTRRQNEVCFNCDGDHLLANCKLPRDMKRISVARRIFSTNKNNANTRYHHHRDKQYNCSTPGEISKRLRGALNLNEDELPTYIYTMRILGYPPGWKLKAQVDPTDLQLYDADGKIQNTPQTKYIDVSQIIKYPGFNVPVPEGIIDDYIRYNYPPYCEQNSLQNIDNFIKYNFDPGYQLLSTISTSSSSTDSLMTEDKMERTDQACSLITENEASHLVEVQCATVIEDQINQLLPSTENECQPEPEIESKVNGTSSGVLVTTILTQNYTDSSLPSIEKFSEGISPLFLFENLSNSTGNYNEISNVIKKIREQKISKKNVEN